MSTEAQIAANRRNAEASTGPRTAEGKARVSRNSTTFGLYSAGDVVRPEEESLYQAFCEDFQQQLAPQGAMETTLAAEIVHAAWRLRRCAAAESSLETQTVSIRCSTRPPPPPGIPSTAPDLRRFATSSAPVPNCAASRPNARPETKKPHPELYPGRPPPVGPKQVAPEQSDKTNPIRSAPDGIDPPRRPLPLRFRSEIQTLLRHERPGCAFACGLTSR